MLLNYVNIGVPHDNHNNSKEKHHTNHNKRVFYMYNSVVDSLQAFHLHNTDEVFHTNSLQFFMIPSFNDKNRLSYHIHACNL